MWFVVAVDLCRLGQEAKALMVPTVEDVFHADTNSTDDYLGEIQSMTILTAIQVCALCCCAGASLHQVAACQAVPATPAAVAQLSGNVLSAQACSTRLQVQDGTKHWHRMLASASSAHCPQTVCLPAWLPARLCLSAGVPARDHHVL